MEAMNAEMARTAYQKKAVSRLPAAEVLALATVRVLAERFDVLDKRVSDYLARHDDDQPKATEWSSFRARLFEEPHI